MVKRRESETTEHRCWKDMKSRCNYTKNKKYYRYGGRGIRVCERWNHYANFLADMGRKPSPKHTLERLDNDGNYEPGNCVWATWTQQRRNTSQNRLITCNGVTRCLIEWSERTGITPDAIRCRIKRGWPVEEAVTQPLIPNGQAAAVRVQLRKEQP